MVKPAELLEVKDYAVPNIKMYRQGGRSVKARKKPDQLWLKNLPLSSAFCNNLNGKGI